MKTLNIWHYYIELLFETALDEKAPYQQIYSETPCMMATSYQLDK